MRIPKYVLPFSVLAIALSPVGSSQAPGSATSSTRNPQAAAGVVVTIAGKNRNSSAPPTQNDFLVKDEGRSAGTVQLRPMKDEPLIFSLLLDTSGSTRDVAPEQVKAAARLFNALSSGKNKGYLILFRYEVFPNDAVLDAAAAERILTRPMDRAGATAVYDAIVHAATKQLATTKYPVLTRRAIFLFSDGADNVSHTTLEHTLAIVQREGVQIFPIMVPAREHDIRNVREERRDARILTALSRGTGGLVIESDHDGHFVSRVLQILSGQYELDFMPSATKPRKLHSLEVKPSSMELEVLAPAKYLAP